MTNFFTDFIYFILVIFFLFYHFNSFTMFPSLPFFLHLSSMFFFSFTILWFSVSFPVFRVCVSGKKRFTGSLFFFFFVNVSLHFFCCFVFVNYLVNFQLSFIPHLFVSFNVCFTSTFVSPIRLFRPYVCFTHTLVSPIRLFHPYVCFTHTFVLAVRLFHPIRFTVSYISFRLSLSFFS